MKNYLSFGGGVNSAAMYLLLKNQGVDFEAVFVDHGTDWPETYTFIDKFIAKYPLTVLTPKDGNLYDYCWDHRMVPATWPRWCTRQFKVSVLHKYYKKPCFEMIGFDYGEAYRAKLHVQEGVEKRFPLIEAEMFRGDCIKMIMEHDCPMPTKSGCYICPFMNIQRWKDLRMKHPDLFCKAEQLEKRNMEYRKSKGKKPMYLYGNAKPLKVVVEENQMRIFKQDEYPPCECML